ncbi:MAG: PD-(D/E)XK nuclease family protein [Alphaproteobacteria bacterium]|jgi:hypothetical protein|nr:PD-(D/E)XK nuclease family protein [Alphaproteobacteria bacterium]
MKPNIFEIATKELSQDAFFTWLLQYADESNENENKELSACAKEFVSYLISKQLPTFTEDIKTVKEVERQWEYIDISAVINNKIFIIIEDKTNTEQHGNQLEDYRTIAKDYCKEKNYQELICIYLKTGAESQSSLNKVKEEGFSTIGTEELLNIFNKYNVKNDIFNDFHTNLKNIYEGQKSFETNLIKDWDYANWQGFYTYLDSVIDGNWHYVNNLSGGFLGFWWCSQQKNDCWLYLQIEQDKKYKQGKLCFKLSASGNKTAQRNEWHSIIMSKAHEKNKTEIKKPKRFGTGNRMTVAVVEQEDWLGDINSTLNKEEVVRKLKDYEKFLKECLL